jgi:hypothetical protein
MAGEPCISALDQEINQKNETPADPTQLMQPFADFLEYSLILLFPGMAMRLLGAV